MGAGIDDGPYQPLIWGPFGGTRHGDKLRLLEGIVGVGDKGGPLRQLLFFYKSADGVKFRTKTTDLTSCIRAYQRRGDPPSVLSFGCVTPEQLDKAVIMAFRIRGDRGEVVDHVEASYRLSALDNSEELITIRVRTNQNRSRDLSLRVGRATISRTFTFEPEKGEVITGFFATQVSYASRSPVSTMCYKRF
jgi:hypothetical protein